MWFDTILWLVAVVAFIMVEAATTALVRSGLRWSCRAMLVSFLMSALAGRCFVLPLYRLLRSA